MTTTTNGEHSGILIKYDETSAEVQIKDVLVRVLWNDENRPCAEPQVERKFSYLHDKKQFWKNPEKIIELETENKELKKVNAESFDHYCLQSEKLVGLKDLLVETLSIFDNIVDDLYFYRETKSWPPDDDINHARNALVKLDTRMKGIV